MRNLLPEPIYKCVQLFWPPSDLYDPLVLKQVDLQRPPVLLTQTYVHKYKGLHVLGIKVEKKIPMPVKTYDWGGRYFARFLVESNEVLTRSFGDSPSPRWSAQANYFDFIQCDVQRDLPLGVPITLNISFVSEGKFPAEYGLAWINVDYFLYK